MSWNLVESCVFSCYIMHGVYRTNGFQLIYFAGNQVETRQVDVASEAVFVTVCGQSIYLICTIIFRKHISYNVRQGWN